MSEFKIKVLGIVLWCFGLKKTLYKGLGKYSLDNRIFYLGEYTALPTKKGINLINNINKRLNVLTNKKLDNKDKIIEDLNKEHKKILSSFNIRDVKFEDKINKVYKWIREHPNKEYPVTEGIKDRRDIDAFNKSADDYWDKIMKVEGILRNATSVDELLKGPKPKEVPKIKKLTVSNGDECVSGDPISIGKKRGVLVHITNLVTEEDMWYILNSRGESEIITNPLDVEKTKQPINK